MRVGLVAQRGNARAAALAGDIAEQLRAVGETALVDEVTSEALDVAGTPTETFDGADLVVSIGGDGTFLYAARHADTTPIMGVNLGEVGFLNAVAPADAVDRVLEAVDRFQATGSVRSRPVTRLRAAGVASPDGDETWSLGPALNEITVQASRRGPGGGLTVEVRVDGSLYTATRADGVLAATPTGSTAYNLSEGGPLLHPGVDGLVVTGMSPAEPMPPVVVDTDAEIVVRAEECDELVVSADGRIGERPTPPEWVRIERAAEPARVAGPAGEFFQALSKLE